MVADVVGGASKRVTIEAPEDIQILSVAPDGPVHKSASLYQLRSLNVERMALQLSAFKAHLDIV
jgi:hypothetical protein